MGLPFLPHLSFLVPLFPFFFSSSSSLSPPALPPSRRLFSVLLVPLSLPLCFCFLPFHLLRFRPRFYLYPVLPVPFPFSSYTLFSSHPFYIHYFPLVSFVLQWRATSNINIYLLRVHTATDVYRGKCSFVNSTNRRVSFPYYVCKIQEIHFFLNLPTDIE